MAESFDDLRLSLLKQAANNYTKLQATEKGPISATPLDITTKSGWAGLVTVIVAAIGAVVAATEHLDPAVTVGAMGFAAISILALALVVRSDHSARAAVTVAMAEMVPSLISASRASSPTPPAATLSAAPPSTGTHFVAIHPRVKVTLKNEDEMVELVALRFDATGDSTSIGYLVGQSGHSDLRWRSEADVTKVTFSADPATPGG